MRLVIIVGLRLVFLCSPEWDLTTNFLLDNGFTDTITLVIGVCWLWS